MNKSINLLYVFFLAVSLLFLSACGGGGSDSSSEAVVSKRAGINEVIVHISADAQGLNPLITSDATASQVNSQTHQYLLHIDDDTYDLIPQLAKAKPSIEIVEENGVATGMIMDFEIREEAVWDNGTPVTGHDYAFTVKAINCPAISETGHMRPYFKFIDDIVIDKENPKKFRLICNKVYSMAEYGAGNTGQILPAYHYDANGVLANYTVSELKDPEKAVALKGKKDLIDFAEEFTSEKYQREMGYVVGSGPYKFAGWDTGQRIVLEKKENWWGESLANENSVFASGPDKITYEIITDVATTLSAIRDEGLDVSKTFSSKVFVEELQNDDKFKSKYNLYNPAYIAFSYLGMNTRRPILADKNVRLALTHAYDVEYVIETFLFGLAERTIGPFHPSQAYYNNDIVPYEFDLEKSKALLNEAGWIDSDGNGIRDKVLDGKKTELEIVFKYTPGSTTTESILLLFQKNLEEIGIKLELTTREWTIYLDELNSHDFDMYIGSWVNDPGPNNDPYQLWHTESYNGGSNYCGFGNAESDALIEAIQLEMDVEKRKQLYLQFQEMLHEEVPYIFTTTFKKKVATHKRFDNAEGKVTRTGYVVNSFQLDPGFGTGSKATKPEN